MRKDRKRLNALQRERYRKNPKPFLAAVHKWRRNIAAEKWDLMHGDCASLTLETAV
jgi:hypothetical protein